MIYPPDTRDPDRIANIGYVIVACIIIVLFLAHYALG